MARRLSLLVDLLMTIIVFLATIFFAGLALGFTLLGGWYLILAALYATNAGLLGYCCKLMSQELWEDW